nr:hypothetical protein CFP56_21092 [Quercus suber]
MSDNDVEQSGSKGVGTAIPRLNVGMVTGITGSPAVVWGYVNFTEDSIPTRHLSQKGMDKKSPDYLTALPPELLYSIVRSLDFRTIVNLRSLCRSLCRVANIYVFRNVAIRYNPRSIHGIHEVANSSTSDLIKNAIFYKSPYSSAACAKCEWKQLLAGALCAMPNLKEAAVVISRRINDRVRMEDGDHHRCGGCLMMPPITDHSGRDAAIFLEALGTRVSAPGIKQVRVLELAIANTRPLQKLMLDECRGKELSSRFQSILSLFRHLHCLKFDTMLPVGHNFFSSHTVCEYTMLLQAATSLHRLELYTTVLTSDTIFKCDHFSDLFLQPTPPWPRLVHLSMARLSWNATSIAIVRSHASSLRSLSLSRVDLANAPKVQRTWRQVMHWLAEGLDLTELSLCNLSRQVWNSEPRGPMDPMIHCIFVVDVGAEETTNDYQAVQDYVLRGTGSLPLLDEGKDWLSATKQSRGR